MTNKYFGGKVSDAGVYEEVDADLKAVVTAAAGKVSAKMEDFKIADAIFEIMNVFRRANKYIDETMPWALAKDESKKDRLMTVLYNLLESIVVGTSLLSAFIPDSCEKTVNMLNTSIRDYDSLDKFGLAKEYAVTDKPEILFARIDVAKVMEKVNAMIEERKEKAQAKEEKKEEKKPEVKLHDHSEKPAIEIDDFAKVQLKIALVTACEKVEKSKKLLKLTVKIGEEVRTVVSGIALAYTPEQLVGKKLAMITNLKPAKLCGIVSEGMIVCAEDENGNLAYLTPEKDIADGSQIF
jgi:methionyl-tRNA synthetase